jgi:hypothetical protein
MPFDSLRDRIGPSEGVTALGIAHNDLFTPKEKLELLNQLKADLTVAQQEGLDPGIDPQDIDHAIAVVRQDIEAGVGTETPARGDA